MLGLVTKPYQQKDEEFAQGPSALATAIVAATVRTDASAMSIRVCDHSFHALAGVIVYQPQMALRYVVVAACELVTVTRADACHGLTAMSALPFKAKVTLKVLLHQVIMIITVHLECC